jgi:transcriptional regulator CtsR
MGLEAVLMEELLDVTYDGLHEMKEKMIDTVTHLLEKEVGTEKEKAVYLALMNMKNFNRLETSMMAAVSLIELAKLKMEKSDNDQSTS